MPAGVAGFSISSRAISAVGLFYILVDLLVEFEHEQKTLAHLVGLGDLLESVLGRHVELVTAEGLSPFLRPHILADAADVVRAA